MTELKLLSPHSTAAEIKQLSGYPRLKPAFVLKMNIGNGHQVGTLGSGQTLTLWDLGSGTFTSAEGYDYEIDGEIVYGADWLLVEPDNTHAIPNLKFIIKTKDGAVISSEYTGTGIFSQPVIDMWAGDPKAKTFPFGISATSHTFKSGDERYKALQYKTFVGNGRFIVNENPRSITVESRISEVIPSNDFD